MEEWFLSLASVEDPGSVQLSDFTRDVEAFLRFILANNEDFSFLWENDPRLRDMAQQTFDEDVTRAAMLLRDAIPAISAPRIQAHGLRGKPLRFKFNVIASIARQWEKVKGKVTVRGWLKQIFDAIDAVLDSLIEAAGGVGGLLKEFKDALSALARTT